MAKTSGKTNFSSSLDPDTLPDNPKELSNREIASHINHKTTLKVLKRFQKIEYKGNIADALDLDRSTVRYHTDKLLYFNVIEVYSRHTGRTSYKITEEPGKDVIEYVNLPDE